MTRRWVAIIAAVSLVATVVLLCGYFGQVGIALINNDVAAARYTVVQWTVEEGRIVLRHYRTAAPLPSVGIPPGRAVLFPVRFGRPPSLRRSVWEFDAHRVSSPGAGQLTVVACPIWCLLLPSLIAPLLWLRRWRVGRTPPKGFDVLPPNDPPPPPPSPASLSKSTAPSSTFPA